ncbi:uncharacterized protein TNCV_4323351 [Trichonephila clavipes]|nr:uncharacterized protein TNCV_4323351 [Trichonephila clavipes]
MVWEGHKSECDINHLGSSTSMEMEAALTLWKRSTTLGFRYITVLSDGDCKTFNYLCEKKCGKAHGSLKEATIKKLTTYYQKAILRNKGDRSLKTAIYAHCCIAFLQMLTSQHSKKCPAGRKLMVFLPICYC